MAKLALDRIKNPLVAPSHPALSAAIRAMRRLGQTKLAVERAVLGVDGE